MTHMNPHFKLNSVISSISRPKPRRKRTKRSVEEFGSDLLHWSIDRQLTNASPWKQKPKQKRTARQTLCALCGQTFINAPHLLQRRLECGHFAHLQCDDNATIDLIQADTCQLCQPSDQPHMNLVFNPHIMTCSSSPWSNAHTKQRSTTKEPPPTQSKTSKAPTPRACPRRSSH